MIESSAGSANDNCSITNKRKIYGVIVKDGKWHQLLVDLYQAVINWLTENEHKQHGNQHAITCVLGNVYNGFCTLANGTHLCRDVLLQQQTFDRFFELILKQLDSKRLLMALKRVTEESDSLISEIAQTMLITLHNFTYYYEPSIAVMREKGTISVVRRIRDECETSDVKTSSLLIIAYLLNESDKRDDKNIMKMTDDELTYFIAELEQSLLSKSASSYLSDELIDGLNRIAVVDMNKLKLIEHGILPLLVKALNRRHPARYQAAAANAIWNLAFTEESRQEIIGQKGCMNGNYCWSKRELVWNLMLCYPMESYLPVHIITGG